MLSLNLLKIQLTKILFLANIWCDTWIRAMCLLLSLNLNFNSPLYFNKFSSQIQKSYLFDLLAFYYTSFSVDTVCARIFPLIINRPFQKHIRIVQKLQTVMLVFFTDFLHLYCETNLGKYGCNIVCKRVLQKGAISSTKWSEKFIVAYHYMNPTMGLVLENSILLICMLRMLSE